MEVVTMGKECWRWDVFLPADWRAKDAARLAAGKETRWADDDDVYIAVYAGYLQALAAGTTEPPDEAAAQLAVIRAACELAERNDPLKWEVQARLLARQTDEEIAACVHRASRSDQLVRAAVLQCTAAARRPHVDCQPNHRQLHSAWIS